MLIIMSNMDKKFELSYKHFVGLGVGVLVVFWMMVLFSDVLNVFGTREIYSGLNVPFLFDFLFKERAPVEMFQWFFLGIFAVTCGVLYGRLDERDRKKEGIFWLIFAVAAVLMLMEDAGNIRHFVLREYLSFEWGTLNILETLYFGAIAFLPVYAVIRYGKLIKKSRITAILLALGFLFYGTAVFLSGPADLTPINRMIGNGFYEATVYIGGEELRELYDETDERLAEQASNGFMDVRYRFIDSFLEESLELLGATMLLASAVSYREFIRE